jgi:hypothetical protein
VRFEQRGAIAGREPRAGQGPIQNTLNPAWHVLSLFVTCAISKMSLRETSS